MKPRRYQALATPTREWPPGWKNPLHTWLLDAAVMMAGAWIFLAVGQLVLKVMRALLP